MTLTDIQKKSLLKLRNANAARTESSKAAGASSAMAVASLRSEFETQTQSIQNHHEKAGNAVGNVARILGNAGLTTQREALQRGQAYPEQSQSDAVETFAGRIDQLLHASNDVQRGIQELQRHDIQQRARRSALVIIAASAIALAGGLVFWRIRVSEADKQYDLATTAIASGDVSGFGTRVAEMNAAIPNHRATDVADLVGQNAAKMAAFEATRRFAGQETATRAAVANQTAVAATLTAQPTRTPTPTIPTPTRATPTPTSTPVPTSRVPFANVVEIPAGSFTVGSSGDDDLNRALQLCKDYKDRDQKPTYLCDSWSFRREFIVKEALALEKLSPGPLPSSVRYYDSRTAQLNRFYIDQYEVTNRRYTECVRRGQCNAPQTNGSNPRRANFADRNYLDHPVTYVTYRDAEQFCAAAGGRLPTSLEWEKAARGRDGNVFPWGNSDPDRQANVREPGYPYADEGRDGNQRVGGGTSRVGSFPHDRSPFDVMDMGGNVMEYVNSALEEDKLELRGSSWNGPWYSARAANRIVVEARARKEGYFDVGFRCAYDSRPAN